jgi:hypothetical protein
MLPLRRQSPGVPIAPATGGGPTKEDVTDRDAALFTGDPLGPDRRAWLARIIQRSAECLIGPFALSAHPELVEGSCCWPPMTASFDKLRMSGGGCLACR